MNLTFIINGEELLAKVYDAIPLIHSVWDVLKASGNGSRPVGEWEPRDTTGVILEMDRSPVELKLADGARIFLSVRVGAGGGNG